MFPAHLSLGGFESSLLARFSRVQTFMCIVSRFYAVNVWWVFFITLPTSPHPLPALDL